MMYLYFLNFKSLTNAKRGIEDMMILLAENIKKYRKSMNLTQEQLAERLSVSVSTISKWEKGTSFPDIIMLAKLADFFGISVDTLISYELKHRDADKYADSINSLTRNRKFEEAIELSETALLKFPNNFRIYIESSNLYKTLYITSHKNQSGEKALELLHKSLDLIYQNNDEHIGTVSIHRDIASIYSLMGYHKKAINEYKMCNYCGINDVYIAQMLSEHIENAEESLLYITNAMIKSVTERNMIVIAAANIFTEKRKYNEAIEILQWECTNIRGLLYDNETTYYDRIFAITLSLLTLILAFSNSYEQMSSYIKQAYEHARKFDKHPNYNLSEMKYAYTDSSFFKTAFDSFGSTTIDVIDHLLNNQRPVDAKSANAYNSLLKLWNDMLSE